MIKKLFLGFIALGLIALVVIYFVGSSMLNKGVKRGVETFGPKMTQTNVLLEDVNLSILSGSGSLKSLVIGNPQGYESENIFSLGQIDVEVDTGSLLGDKIIIDKIHIIKPEISYEKTFSSSNVKDLLKNIEAFSGPKDETPAADTEPETGPRKQVVIRKLIIEEGTIFVGALGVSQTVSLPRIEMDNIGEGNSITLADAIDLILSKVLTNIGPAIANSGELLKSGGQAIIDSASKEGLKQVDEAAAKAGESLKGLFGK